MNATNPLTTTLPHAAGQGIESLAQRADSAIESTRSAANGALDSLQSGVSTLRDTAPSALARAAAQVDDLTRRGIEGARAASSQVRHQLAAVNDRTCGYVRDEPMKSVLIAAATGAAAAALIGWLVRSRSRSAI